MILFVSYYIGYYLIAYENFWWFYL